MSTSTLAKFELKMGGATRDAYGKALADLGRQNPNIVVLDADLSKSTKTAVFAKEFPKRFFTCGIAEADMVGIAGGLASCGKIPFASSFSAFLLCKGFDQLRVAVALPRMNAKFVGTHGGISLGEDGPSQMSVEDYALACALVGFTVVSPADEASTRALVFRTAEHDGPVYMRVGRPKVPAIYAAGDDNFQLGKARVLIEGTDVALIGCGLLVAECLRAAETLAAEGVSAMVVDMHTLKPLDLEAVASACKTGAIVTAEEHLLDGGLGARVAHAAAGVHPVPIESVGIDNRYAESATPEQLIEKYGLTAKEVLAGARRALKRKRA